MGREAVVVVGVVGVAGVAGVAGAGAVVIVVATTTTSRVSSRTRGVYPPWIELKAVAIGKRLEIRIQTVEMRNCGKLMRHAGTSKESSWTIYRW